MTDVKLDRVEQLRAAIDRMEAATADYREACDDAIDIARKMMDDQPTPQIVKGNYDLARRECLVGMLEPGDWIEVDGKWWQVLDTLLDARLGYRVRLTNNNASVYFRDFDQVPYRTDATHRSIVQAEEDDALDRLNREEAKHARFDQAVYQR